LVRLSWVTKVSRSFAFGFWPPLPTELLVTSEIANI
jgi:hypothetical protein